MKLFDAFEENGVLVDQTEFVDVYSVKWKDKEYKIIIPKRVANKRTVIYFVDKTVYWEQLSRFPRLAGKGYNNRVPIYKFNGKIFNTLFVVKGTPLGDEGLDDGIFRSSKRFDDNFVNCITYKKFKQM